MASKSAYSESEKGAEIEEQLEALDKLVDRLRALYEQYFLGIQKQPPTHLHAEADRKIRDLTVLQIRNTGLRYRFAMVGQKFGSYNTYWRRTLREIEAGRYVRDLSRISRKAARNKESIPEEILAAMPKRMREMVARDRAAAVAVGDRRGGAEPDDEAVVVKNAPPRLDSQDRADGPRNVHRLDTSVSDDEFEDMFASLTDQSGRPAGGPDVGDDDPTGEAIPVRPGRAPSDTIPTPMLEMQRDTVTPPPRTAPGSRPPPIPPASRPLATVKPTSAPSPVPPPAAPRATAPAPTTARITPAPRVPVRPTARVAPLEPPPGMSDTDVRSLYAKYAKARELVGEKNDEMTYDKLLKTLRQTAPKIMEQYKAKGVEFGVVIKDNKVILKAKPKL